MYSPHFTSSTTSFPSSVRGTTNCNTTKQNTTQHDNTWKHRWRDTIHGRCVCRRHQQNPQRSWLSKTRQWMYVQRTHRKTFRFPYLPWSNFLSGTINLCSLLLTADDFYLLILHSYFQSAYDWASLLPPFMATLLCQILQLPSRLPLSFHFAVQFFITWLPALLLLQF